MGTPATLIIETNDDLLLKKFFHFDGYFDYAGKEIIKFIKRVKFENIPNLIEQNCDLIKSQEELDEIWNQYFIELNGTDLAAAIPDKNFTKDYPGLSERIDVKDFLEMLEFGPKFKYAYSGINSRYDYTINIDEKTLTYYNDDTGKYEVMTEKEINEWRNE